uniref:Uncharacterized protein n=1 Tax=viral metagenome TaxID=1070528 RepID=A0A6M3JYC3_9ZZZZ
MKVAMTIEKETKGTVRYMEVTKAPGTEKVLLGTLYIKKDTLTDEFKEYPKNITVEVTKSA